MHPKLKDNCRLYTFDPNLLKFGEIEPGDVEVTFENDRPKYLSKSNPELLICQAMNQKKAAAKFLTMVKNDSTRI